MRSATLLLPLCLTTACAAAPSEVGSVSEPYSGVAGTVTGQVFVRGARSTARVMIDGQVVTTNAAGEFTLPNVSATYDAALELTSGVIVYEGMTSRSPTFNVSPQSGIGAALVPMQLPAPPDSVHQVAVFASAADSTVSPFAFGIGPLATTSTLAAGPLGAAITLHALSFDAEPGAGSGIAWTGHAELPLTDVQWTEPTWIVQFEPLTSTSLSVRPVLPDGYALGPVSLFLHGGNSALPSTPSSSASGAFAFSTADLAGVTYDVLVLATGEGCGGGATAIGLAPGAREAAVSFPGAPVSVSPGDGAVVTPGSSFQFAPLSGVAHWVTFAPTVSTASPIQVVTMASTVTIPDLRALGYALTRGGSFDWWVDRNGMPASVDAAAAAGLVVTGGAGQLNGVSSYGQSTKRRVTISMLSQ